MATKSPPGNANSKGVARPESGRPSLASPSAEMDNEQEATVAAFPIVGIGCSAGGLSALEKFFANSPADSGMAFVIVQHLAPAHVSALPELLQRTTRMPVLEAQDGMRVEPDNVYVIPPNHDLSLLHDTLHLLGPLEQRGLRLPIDFFLKTLAADRKDKAIGVILSGMGSDGMFGLRAIKEQAGLTLAQEPASASADSMPNGVINAGLVDIIAIPEELPARIIGFLGHPVLARQPKSAAEAATQSDIEKIVVLLRERSGNDFSLYKTNTLLRRIERRIALHQLSNIASYVHYLRENPQEVDLLFKELLIGVTTFFRDPAVWETLRSTVLPALLAQQTTGKTLRAWVPACSSGEEAYTLAMTFKETLEQGEQDKHFELLIYATDLDPDAVEKARSGRYPTNIAADVSPERLARYFVEEANGYRIRKEIREMVVFAPQNIISDPPFTKLDVLSCRNLLIYFRAQLQQKLLPLFHYALNPDGLLILGSAETVGNLSHRFEPVDNKLRIFRRLNQPLPQSEVEFPAGKSRGTHQPAETPLSVHVENIGQLTDQLGVIQKALRTPQPICLNGLQVGTNGGTQIVNVTVQALEKPGPLRGRVIIVFRDMEPPPPRRKGRRAVVSDTHEALVQELQQTREALQVTHEEMQTSVEEMKSSNEELQSTNEELQSTNEELTTSKEEMQSLNEELQTVNAELQSKVANLSWEQNDMANLLNSTEIATVFLDKAMKLRRFTAHATHLFKLIPGDVGRPLSDLVTDLDYPTLKADAQEVLNTLAFQEKEVNTHDGRCYRVRIMPYRTQEDVIDGVVITFTDISELKKLQEELGRRARK